MARRHVHGRIVQVSPERGRAGIIGGGGVYREDRCSAQRRVFQEISYLLVDFAQALVIHAIHLGQRHSAARDAE
ncbi:MAG TPA: hypothetical protein VGD45_30115 [Steroidobacter sp.]